MSSIERLCEFSANDIVKLLEMRLEMQQHHQLMQSANWLLADDEMMLELRIRRRCRGNTNP
jgi:hypothetical protein